MIKQLSEELKERENEAPVNVRTFSPALFDFYHPKIEVFGVDKVVVGVEEGWNVVGG